MNISELLRALPETDEEVGLRRSSHRTAASPHAVPVGRWRRLSVLASLNSRIAAASLFDWCRGWFQSATQRQKTLAESRWRKAAQILDSMGYLRGAAMKVGQTLANYPVAESQELVETLDQLHFNAPPLHWSLLREMVINELGDDPEALFDEFDRNAFAAASLGQVHRARLQTGQNVAVKVQYPDIANSIRSDIKNFFWLLLPSRLSHDWEYLKRQIDEASSRLHRETNYLEEAATLEHVRSLFRESDGIHVPRPFPHLTTERVLTMELAAGRPLSAFLEDEPTQAQRNLVARRIVRAFFRMWCAGRLAYLDFHPGNILVSDDQQIALVDFGTVLPLDDTLWDYFRRHDQAFTTGDASLLRAANAEWCSMSSEESRQDTVAHAFHQWQCRPRHTRGEYDFRRADEFRIGVDLFLNLVRSRRMRAHPSTLLMIRMHMGLLALMYRLRAQVNFFEIAEEEVLVTGWDRSGYT